jgi:ketosteroid isomerase-like protein
LAADPDPSARPSHRLAVEPSPPRLTDEQSIRAVLQKYRAAYERLDADAARRVWPSVDVRALSRAFNGLRAQQLDFQQCDVKVRDAGASASCRGSATYVPRVGSQETRSEPRRWTFRFEKATSGWVIVRAEAR